MVVRDWKSRVHCVLASMVFAYYSSYIPKTSFLSEADLGHCDVGARPIHIYLLSGLGFRGTIELVPGDSRVLSFRKGVIV